MKTGLVVLFLAALSLAAPEMSPAQTKEANVPDALSVIHSRKSVRSFTGQRVDKATIEKLLRAAMAAPTAVNKQPWAFVVVTDPAALEALKEGLPYTKMVTQAGTAVVVCVQPAKAYENSVELAVLDGACASENLLLAAEALGLGAVWTAAYPYEDRMAVVRKALGIPAGVIPLNVIPVGYPAGEDKPKNKFKPDNIHWDQW